MTRAVAVILCALGLCGCRVEQPAVPAPAEAPPPSLVLVCDSTASMAKCLPAAREDMKRTLGRLGATQRFDVVCFDRSPMREFASSLRLATTAEQMTAERFVDSMKGDGRSKPQAAIQRAFELLAGAAPPREIHFWTDGDFAPGTVAGVVNKLNDRASPVRMHFVVVRPRGAAAGEAAMTELAQVARETGGSVRLLELP